MKMTQPLVIAILTNSHTHTARNWLRNDAIIRRQTQIKMYKARTGERAQGLARKTQRLTGK